MTSESAIFLYRVFGLLIGMAGLYILLTSGYLRMKAFGYVLFQVCLNLLWLSAGNFKSGLSNPIPQALSVSIQVVWVGVSLVLYLLLVGVLRQYGTLKEKEIERKENT
jgi:multisubunit Na+/H+ antiporter MnhC subunit